MVTKQRDYVCALCQPFGSYKVHTLVEMREHKKVQHNVEQRYKYCRHCDYRCKGDRPMRNHHRQFHPELEYDWTMA